MDIKALIDDKSISPKDKTTQLAAAILDGSITTTTLLAFAQKAKAPAKATCIEAMEFATQTNPAIAGGEVLDFVLANLQDKAPRVKWECGKVVANTIHLHPKHLETAISNLLINTTDAGTVVRWSAATAFAAVLAMKTPHNETLVPALQQVMNTEEKNSIKKIYAAAFKKLGVSGR